MKSDFSRPAACWFLSAGLLAVAGAAARAEEGNASVTRSGPSDEPALSLEILAGMTWPELECLYRNADAGAAPEGFAEGKAIYCPGARFSGARSRLTGIVWRGKIFDGADGSLVNQWRGLRAIRARVGYGSSLLDGKPSILMDYHDTSWVWSDVRDEMREVAPGLYLGRMYRCKKGEPEFQIFFALRACPSSAR